MSPFTRGNDGRDDDCVFGRRARCIFPFFIIPPSVITFAFFLRPHFATTDLIWHGRQADLQMLNVLLIVFPHKYTEQLLSFSAWPCLAVA